MDLVFKVITDPVPTIPLILDTNFKDHYSGVNANMPWSELEPAVRQATEKFVLDYIGEDLYEDIAGKFQGGDSLTDEQSKALQLLQDTVAYYTIYYILPERNAVLAALGVMQNTPEQGSAQPVSQWGWKAKRTSALENADTFLDRLLSFLEKQVTAGTAYFDLWKDSEAYNVKTSNFFRHTSELDEYLNIQNSRRSFISIVRFCKQIEEDYIKTLLCDDLYTDVTGSDPSDDALTLVPMIKRAVAYLGAASAIPHHRVVTDGDGFRIVSQLDGFDERRNLTNNTHQSAIEALLVRCQKQGDTALSRLKKFLEDNIDDYPDYADSSCREKPAEKGHSIVKSDGGTGAIGLF